MRNRASVLLGFLVLATQLTACGDVEPHEAPIEQPMPSHVVYEVVGIGGQGKAVVTYETAAGPVEATAKTPWLLELAAGDFNQEDLSVQAAWDDSSQGQISCRVTLHFPGDQLPAEAGTPGPGSCEVQWSVSEAADFLAR